MVDPAVKGSEVEDANPNGASSGNSPSNEHKKTCADCGTTKTPLWRGGPAGPKSLCNACGIRSRKKKRAILGISKGTNEDHHKKGKRNGSGSSKVGGERENLSLKQSQRLYAVGKEVLMQRSHWKKLGEEEKAAVLLMSLSCGSVYA